MIWNEVEQINLDETAQSARQNEKPNQLQPSSDKQHSKHDFHHGDDKKYSICPDIARLTSGEPNVFLFSSQKLAIHLRIFYFIPNQWSDNDPVLFCMHGVQRNAEAYVQNCSDLLTKTGGNLILICPEFSRENFPTNWEYNLGNIVDTFDPDSADLSTVTFKQTDHWTFSLIEDIFDRFKELTGLTTEGYHIYGHSAGAQFVHRYSWISLVLVWV